MPPLVGRIGALLVSLSFVFAPPSSALGQQSPETVAPTVPDAYRAASPTPRPGDPPPTAARPVAAPSAPDTEVTLPDTGSRSRASRRHDNRWAPRDAGWTLAYGLHFLAGEGYGLFLDLDVAYRPMKREMALAFIVDPVAVGLGGRDTVGAFAARTVLSLDRDTFAFGGSVGVLHARIVDGTRRTEGWGSLLGVVGRFGARDGLHFEARFEFVPVELTAGGAFYAFALQIPTVGPWVRMDVRGGATGTVTVDFALRFRVRRAREGRSLFVTPSIGFGEILDPIDSITYSGMLVGLRLEQRL